MNRAALGDEIMTKAHGYGEKMCSWESVVSYCNEDKAL